MTLSIVTNGNVKTPVPVPPMSSGSARFSKSATSRLTRNPTGSTLSKSTRNTLLKRAAAPWPLSRSIIDARPEVELIDDQAALSGIRGEGAFQHGVEEAPTGRDGHPLEA